MKWITPFPSFCEVCKLDSPQRLQLILLRNGTPSSETYFTVCKFVAGTRPIYTRTLEYRSFSSKRFRNSLEEVLPSFRHTTYQ